MIASVGWVRSSAWIWVFSSTRLSFVEELGLALSVAMVGGHKRKQDEKWLAKVALARLGR